MKDKTAQSTNSGRKLGLVFDFNAFTELQDKHGLNVLDKAKLDAMELTPVVVRQLVWAGLLHKHPELTLEEAGKRVGSMANLADVIPEIMAALSKAFTGK